jgi:hypothetical protein
VFSTKGYEYIKSVSEKHGYVLGHRQTMERVLGRRLAKSEVVHHIDKDRLNNHPDNLFVTDTSGHRIAHASLEDVAILLLGQGKIRFNREKGIYELV